MSVLLDCTSWCEKTVLLPQSGLWGESGVVGVLGRLDAKIKVQLKSQHHPFGISSVFRTLCLKLLAKKSGKTDIFNYHCLKIHNLPVFTGNHNTENSRG